MKHSLLLLLCLPLSALAQYRPMYSAPRPAYTPSYSQPYKAPTYSGTSTMEIHNRQLAQRNQAQQMQQSMQYFQRFQQQQQTQAMWHQMTMQQHALLRRRSSQQLAADRAEQQLAEQKAAEQLSQLRQEQQRKQLEQPAPDAAQAAARQQEDARQLTRLAVKNYQEVFLPGQITSALQAQTLPQPEQEKFNTIGRELLSSSWWSQQDAAQLGGKLAAHSQALAELTGNLLGYDITSAAPTPAPFAIGRLDDQLAANTFDQALTAQLIGAAAQADKLAAGAQLAEAVRSFTALAAKVAATPGPVGDPKALRAEAKASMRNINKGMQGYHVRIAASPQLYQAQKAICKSTAAYLAKSEPAAK